ncbi:hypothetical protein AT1G05783 [Arabidopsis thaliana]|uniref:Uncharacterized protein n=1 Tax=Arabidopsis thaliana TaxID=3702 RepID=A0A1P8AQA7_ARATH|nr:uncharacterized protein AT1G05783 [Arabidopsis thaliana]ANM58820.1 hypothetical protein AT1G05783 [Arabidopsis thaliana]|eukprot:NP_001321231.1 hypothetical protein AT1G05783 [Arabidopsis thaliana]
MASSEIICDDVTQRLFWMMSSYKGYFWNLVEYGEQQRRTTVKIREMMTQIRRLREVSNKEKSYALHQFKNDFRLDLQNDMKTNRTLDPIRFTKRLLDLQNDMKSNRTLDLF